MLQISSAEIASAGGLLAALSVKAADYIAELMKTTDTRMPKSGNDVARLISHASPHLDEYFAALVFRALLPPAKRGIPLDEAVIGSRRNDTLARSIWPEAAVFGIGATVDGGARPLLLYDEHTNTGEKRRASSCSELAINRLVKGGAGAVPPELFWVFGEIDHIDANGLAHELQLNNVIKWLHDVSFTLNEGATPFETITERLTSGWKHGVVDACIVAMLYVLRARIDFSNPETWRPAAGDSLRHYSEHTLLRTKPHFMPVYQRLRSIVMGFPGPRGGPWLEVRGADGTKRPHLDKRGRKIPQRLVLPWLTAACVECWGPQLGHIVMAHFWEAFMMNQLSFVRVQEELTSCIGDGSVDVSTDTPVGEIQFRSLKDVVVTPVGSAEGTNPVSPWVIFFRPRPDVDAPKPPVSNFVRQKNQGVGLFAIVNPRSDTVVLTREQGLPDDMWTAVVDHLIEREGDSDARDVAGCWHVTRDEQGRIANFLLNGNKAHQYVPRTALRGVDGLSELLRSAATVL